MLSRDVITFVNWFNAFCVLFRLVQRFPKYLIPCSRLLTNKSEQQWKPKTVSDRFQDFFLIVKQYTTTILERTLRLERSQT